MDPSFSLSIRDPQTSKSVELVVRWLEEGWEIHELDGTVTVAESEGLKLMNLLTLHNLASPDFREALSRMWFELDLAAESVNSPADVDPRILREVQGAFAQIGTWIEVTSASKPRGGFF